MASALQSALGTKILKLAWLTSAPLLASGVLHAQGSNSYLLAARRNGTIEIIDQSSLAPIARIHFDLAPKSSGFNGVSASTDGTMLYVEGPVRNGPRPGGCCVLYSIDLATLETKQVADIPGTASRAAFVVSDGITYHPVALPPNGSAAGSNGVNSSSDGRRLFEVRRFRGPALDIYDSFEGKIVRTLVPEGLQGDWWPTGAQLDDQFVLYAANDDSSAARLWLVSPETTELGEGITVEPFGDVPNCHSPIEPGMSTAGGNVFLYEIFGWKLDRRTSCSGVPGGAWVLDPSTGTLLAHVASDFYFSRLVADRARGELYGISVADPTWRNVQLVSIDARDGTILKSRVLDDDVWSIAFAPLRDVPRGDVRALLP